MFGAREKCFTLVQNTDPKIPGAKNYADKGKDRGAWSTVYRDAEGPIVNVKHNHDERGKQSFTAEDLAEFMPYSALVVANPADLVEALEEEEGGKYYVLE